MSLPKRILLCGGIMLLALITLCVAVLISFDWNRARPWINAHVSQATGRSFAINGDLSLKWHAPPEARGWRTWIPWPHLAAHDVNFGNPEWASEPLMVRVAQVTFSVSTLPLLSKKIVIPSLAIDTPQLYLQRLKDGRTNWDLESPGSSDWQVELRELVLERGSVHFVDEVKHADVRVQVDSLGQQQRTSHYQIGWTVNGSFNGEKVSGNGKAGAVLALRKQRSHYPVQAHLAVGKTVIDASGTLGDPGKPAAVDLQLKISSVSMAQLYPLTGLVLPETPPFSTEGRLTGSPNRMGGDWSYQKFTGRIGGSDLSGNLKYISREPRPLLEGTLVSNYLAFPDLAPLIGADSAASKAQREAKVKQPDNKVLPVEAFRTERWKSIDADVQFSGKKIVRDKQLPIDNLVARMRLQDGVLSLAPLKFALAGGNLVSNIRLDGNAKPARGEMKLSARHLRLQQLFPALRSNQASLGELNGDATLNGSGNSVADLLASANGEVKAVVNQGTVSKLLLEQLGLNISSIVATKLFGDRQVKLNCAVNDFAVSKGVMHARASVIDTEESMVHLSGDINLGQEKLALKIQPESKGLRLVSLGAPIYVSGPFRKPEVDVDRGMVALKAGSAVALGVLAPVAAALLPLVHVGPGEKSACGQLLALAQAQPKPDVATAARKREAGDGMNASGR